LIETSEYKREIKIEINRFKRFQQENKVLDFGHDTGSPEVCQSHLIRWRGRLGS